MGSLTLTRKVTERIKIGADIEIEVVKIKGNQVLLRTTAPNEIRVLRSELDESVDGSAEAGSLTDDTAGSQAKEGVLSNESFEAVLDV